MMKKSKNILVTGASSGIGHSICVEFLKRGYNVFGSVRKQNDASRLAETLADNFEPLIFDVTDFEAVGKAAEYLAQKIGNEGLGGLINNAGIAVAGSLMDLSVADFKYQFEVNVFGQLAVTKSFLPLLGARKDHLTKPGRILQMSSVAGKFGMPFMSAYAGSKHALEGISESLRRELIKYEIDVIVLGPGPIKTSIWEKSAGENPQEKFKGSSYQEALHIFRHVFVQKAIADAWSSERAAKATVDIFEKVNPKTRYALVSKRLRNWIIPQLVPGRLIDDYLAKKLKLK